MSKFVISISILCCLLVPARADETGRHQGDWVEILSNKIQPGERIVLLGNENLRPNQAVKVQQE